MTRGKTTTQTAANRERHRILKAMLEARRDEIQAKLRVAARDAARRGRGGQGPRGAERPRLRAGRRAGADGDEVGDAGQDRRGDAAGWRRAPTAPAPSAARRSRRRGCRPCPSRRCAATARSEQEDAARRPAATASLLQGVGARRAHVPRGSAEARAARGERAEMSEPRGRPRSRLRVERRAGGGPDGRAGGARHPAAARHAPVPARHPAPGRRARELGGPRERRGARAQGHRRGDAARPGGRRPGRERPLPDRHADPHPQDVQVPRRLLAAGGAGRAALPRSRRSRSTGRSSRPASSCCSDARAAGAGDRGARARAERAGPVPAGGGALPHPLGRAADAGRQHPGPGPPGRLRRRPACPSLSTRAEAGDAGDARRQGAPGAAQQGAGEGPGGAGGRQQDPEPGEDGAAEEPARVLPARADEGHPEGAGRGRRPAARADRAARQDRGGRHARGRQEGGAARAGPAGQDVARRGRVHRDPDLPGLADRAALEQAHRGGDRPVQGQGGPGQRPLRPGEGQGAHPRVPGRAQDEARHQGARSCASWALPAWARPASASRSPARWAASSTA